MRGKAFGDSVIARLDAEAKRDVGRTAGLLGNQSTSQILAQQASQVRQAARQKGSLLLELVPTTAKQLASKQPTVSSPPHDTVMQQAPSPPDIAQRGCDPLRGAVQECIAEAGLPLAKPFYQQAVERALEDRTQPAQTNYQGKNPVRQAGQVPASVAQAATGNAQPIVTKQGEQSESMRQPSPEEPVLSDAQDSDLGAGLTQPADKEKARRYMSKSHWSSAVILSERARLLVFAVQQHWMRHMQC